VDFNSHMDAVVTVAVELVNAATPGQARGRDYRPPTGAELTDAVAGVLHHTTRDGRRHTALDAAEAQRLAAEATRLRAVFAAVDSGDVDEAATIVNGLLTGTGARPVLSRHDGEPWHLHFHGSDGSAVSGWLAACATGLAVVLGGEYADRLGVCSAPACDRVYVDTSRNGTRRFCSTTCQNRVKAAAYRSRRPSV
jgi:predicted RNA-binding Zn ribbon-like protein